MPRANEVTPYALKGQKLLAQGIALGNVGIKLSRPERAKAFNFKAFAFQGAWFIYFFSIFFNSFSNLLRYISPAMVKPNGKAIQMPSNAHAARETEGIAQWQ